VIAQIKAASWKVLAGLYRTSGLRRIRHPGRAAILTYHRVVSDGMLQEGGIQAGMYVRRSTFDAHLAYLRAHFQVVSLEFLLDVWKAGELDGAKSYCAITFDDGWRDNFQEAFPLLKKHGVPATIFLTTDYIGTEQWFWPDQVIFLLERVQDRPLAARVAAGKVLQEALGLSAMTEDGRYRDVDPNDLYDHDAIVELCKQKDVETIRVFIEKLSRAVEVGVPARRVLLTWDEVREMASCGVSFGSHSSSHRILTRIPTADARHELTGSWTALVKEGIKPIPVFCYPNGNYNPEVQALVKESGYLAATSCDSGLEGRTPKDLYALRRITMHEGLASSPSLFRLSLSGLRP